MSQHQELYGYTDLYDVIFDRDVSGEVKFILDACYRWRERPPRSALEVCCGPGYHIRTLNRFGLKTVGVDLSRDMLRFAHQKTSRCYVPMTWLEADMRWFRLREPVDVAFCLLGGLQALLTDDDVIQHFRTVAGNISERGLYILELPHPREYAMPEYQPCRYAGRREEVEAELVWATNAPPIDLVTGISQVDVELRVKNGPERKVFSDTARERMILPSELRLLVRLAGCFDLVGLLGDFRLDWPLDNSEASMKMVAVLQKR